MKLAERFSQQRLIRLCEMAFDLFESRSQCGFDALIGQITSLCFDLRYEVSHLIDVRWSAGDISRRISRAEISGGLEVFDGMSSGLENASLH